MSGRRYAPNFNSARDITSFWGVVVGAAEAYQIPAPLFQVGSKRMHVTLRPE